MQQPLHGFLPMEQKKTPKSQPHLSHPYLFFFSLWNLTGAVPYRDVRKGRPWSAHVASMSRRCSAKVNGTRIIPRYLVAIEGAFRLEAA